MNVIRNSVWSTLLLGLAVGCAGEPEGGPAAPGSAAKENTPGPAVKAPKPAAPSAATPAKPGAMKEHDEPPAVEGPKAENSKSGRKEIKLTAEEIAAIKELPAADQAGAIQQAVCPVSSHHLGSMEKPVKVTAGGRTFYLCCESCEDEVKSDPKGVIAKLDRK